MADAEQPGTEPGTEPGAAPGQAGRPVSRALDDAARREIVETAAPESRAAQGTADGAERTGRDLAGALEAAAAGMRSLIGPPNSHPGGFGDAQEAMARLVEGVMATNIRFADELLRRAGPSAVAELQRQFLREYFDAMAKGGALLLRAAREAADACPGSPDGQARERGGGRRVADVMGRDVTPASPDDTVREAARAMGERGTGALPVVENGRLVGLVTDRDLALRALAAGKDPAKTKLRDVMEGEPPFVFEDEPVEAAAASMAERKARWLPVLSREERQLVGMVSLGDLAPAESSRPVESREDGEGSAEH